MGIFLRDPKLLRVCYVKPELLVCSSINTHTVCILKACMCNDLQPTAGNFRIGTQVKPLNHL